MASESFSFIAAITVCFFLVCNANILTSEVTATPDHFQTLLNAEQSSVNSAEITGSPALNVTYATISNVNTTALNTSEPSQFSLSTADVNTPSTADATTPSTTDVTTPSTADATTPSTADVTTPSTADATTPSTANVNTPSTADVTTPSTADATTQSNVNASESSTLKVTVPSNSPFSSTAPLSGPSSSSNNQPDSTTKSAVTVTRVLSTPPLTQVEPTPKSNGTDTTPNGNDTAGMSDREKQSMKYPEIILTSIFSTILVVVLLVILSIVSKRCLRGRSQYSHHPLHETSYESDRYSAPDDTLVISGGLYDAPRIYNPNMTVLEDEESQNDCASFNSRAGQFKLEFLPGDKDMDPVLSRSQRRNV